MNIPPAKAGGFRLRLKAGSIGLAVSLTQVLRKLLVFIPV
jgi:hypothetical protein